MANQRTTFSITDTNLYVPVVTLLTQDLITYDNIRKISTGHGDDYTTGCFQLNKLKSGIKNGTEGTLKISSNVVGDSNDENNFLHKLLSTNIQVLKIRKAFCK